MSEEGFEVHGPHDHAVEHASTSHHPSAGQSMTAQIAMFTAIIATFGAIFGYMAGATQADAGLFKNNAALIKTEAANQWNFYQAKSSKQNLWELALDVAPSKRIEFYTTEIARYKSEKAEIKKAAEKLEAEVKEWEERSDHEMHNHHRWAQATTVLQVCVALAAIALLTRKNWLKKCMYAVGGGGLVIGLLAYLQI
jgi:Na+/glutamate symporter